MQLTLLSWNIWVEGDVEAVKAFLDAHPADVIALQEVRNDDPSRDLIGYLTTKGYHYAIAPIEARWDGQTHRFGVATFTRFPMIDSHKIVLSDPRARTALRTVLDVWGEHLTILNAHLIHTHLRESDIHEQQVSRLLESVPAARAVVLGDFNAPPQMAGIKLVRSALNDADPGGAPTWCQYKAGCSRCQIGEIKHRLDYIFTTPDLVVSNFRVEPSPASDHLPISATIEM